MKNESSKVDQSTIYNEINGDDDSVDDGSNYFAKRRQYYTL